MYAQKFGQDTPLPSIQLCIENVGSLTGACGYGYSCVYANTISWASPTQPLPMEMDPRVAFERLFGDGSTAHGAAGPAARRSQHPRRHHRECGAAAAGPRPERPQPPERLSRKRPRDGAPHPEDREVQHERSGARAAGGADRRARFVRGARQADVRSAGAGVHDGHDARVRVQDGPRRELARLSRKRREDAVPRAVASRRESRPTSRSSPSSTGITSAWSRISWTS